jgi:glutamyl-tRNA reductase
MKGRADRPLMLIDIAVPRDVDPAVAEITGVHLHDIDALESAVQQTMGRWEEDLKTCETIIDQEITNLKDHFKSRMAARNRSHDGVVLKRVV